MIYKELHDVLQIDENIFETQKEYILKIAENKKKQVQIVRNNKIEYMVLTNSTRKNLTQKINKVEGRNLLLKDTVKAQKHQLEKLRMLINASSNENNI